MDESSTNYYLSIVYDPKTTHYDHRLQSLAMVYAPYISMVKTIVILNHVLQSSMIVYSRISPTIRLFIVANDLRNPRPGLLTLELLLGTRYSNPVINIIPFKYFMLFNCTCQQVNHRIEL